MLKGKMAHSIVKLDDEKITDFITIFLEVYNTLFDHN